MDEPLTLTREQVRLVDALAVEQYGMSSLVLMENAGRGVVDVLLRVDPTLGPRIAGPPRGPGPEGVPPRLDAEARRGARPGVAILCGKGNNAGDGFVIARHLEVRDVEAKVLLLCAPDELSGDARRNFEILTHTDVPIVELNEGSIVAQLEEHAGRAAWLIDAMLGTGAVGEPREPFASAIAWTNAQAARRLAVDVPSGLDCDTGQPAPATVRADLTCTFVAVKTGFLSPPARPFLGQMHVVSIGVPPRLVREVAGA